MNISKDLFLLTNNFYKWKSYNDYLEFSKKYKNLIKLFDTDYLTEELTGGIKRNAPEYYFENLKNMIFLFINERKNEQLSLFFNKDEKIIADYSDFTVFRNNGYSLLSYYMLGWEGYFEIKDIFSYNGILTNEIEIKEDILFDSFVSFFINLIPLDYEKMELKEFNKSLFNIKDRKKLEKEYNDVLEKINEDYSTLFDFFYQSIGDESFFNFPMFACFYFWNYNKNYMFIPKSINFFNYENNREFNIFKKNIEKIKTNILSVFSLKQDYFDYNDFYFQKHLLINRTKYINLNPEWDVVRINKNLIMENKNLFLGLNIFSSIEYLKERGIIKKVPGIYEIKNNIFFFKKFDSFKETVNYAGEFLYNFVRVYYGLEPENIFIKKYISESLKNYLKTCSAKEKVYLIDNYFKGNIFTSYLMNNLISKEMKEILRKNYQNLNIYKKELNKIQSLKEKSKYSNLIHNFEIFSKGNESLYPDYETLKSLIFEIEKEDKKNFYFYSFVDRLIEITEEKKNEINIDNWINISWEFEDKNDSFLEYTINSIEEINKNFSYEEREKEKNRLILNYISYTNYEHIILYLFFNELNKYKKLNNYEKKLIEETGKIIFTEFFYEKEYIPQKNILKISLNDIEENRYMINDLMDDYGYELSDNLKKMDEILEILNNKKFIINVSDYNSLIKSIKGIIKDLSNIFFDKKEIDNNLNKKHIQTVDF